MDVPKPETPYDSWMLDPTPDKLNVVVDSLQPIINYQLGNLGSADDPLLRNKARIIAAQAVKKFNPSAGAALPTWVSNQMQQLRRYRRQSSQVLKVPERIQLDAFHLHTKEQEFLDRHDREPDLRELADFSKIPVGRIAKIRQYMHPTPSESAIGDAVPGDELDFDSEALSYIYKDADHLDRRILEMKTGYGGHKVLTPLEIAAKLRISPSQVSRRAARLSLQISKLEQDIRDLST